MPSRIIQDIKPPTDTKRYSFDFTGDMAIGEGIDTAEVTATVFTGVDANPSAIISGSADISGQSVTQLLTGGVLGVVYSILCTVETDEDQELTIACYLAIMKEAVQ